MSHDDDRAPLRRRLLWFALLWFAGVAVVLLMAWMIRLALGY